MSRNFFLFRGLFLTTTFFAIFSAENKQVNIYLSFLLAIIHRERVLQELAYERSKKQVIPGRTAFLFSHDNITSLRKWEWREEERVLCGSTAPFFVFPLAGEYLHCRVGQIHTIKALNQRLALVFPGFCRPQPLAPLVQSGRITLVHIHISKYYIAPPPPPPQTPQTHWPGGSQKFAPLAYLLHKINHRGPKQMDFAMTRGEMYIEGWPRKQRGLPPRNRLGMPIFCK